MKSKGFIFIIMAIMCSVCVEAQNANALDEKNTPMSTSLFGSGKENPKSQSENSIRPKSMLKIPLAEILRTELSLKYEYKINSCFSATGLAGIPLGKDELENFWSVLLNTDNRFAIQNYSLFESGYIYGLSLKYYFNIRDNASPFFEFGYKNVFRKYHITKNEYIPDNVSGRMDYFLFSIGNLWVYGYDKIKITQECSFGLGLKIVSWDTFDAKNIMNSDGYTEQIVYEKNQNRDSYYSPIISVRYTIGIGW